MDARKNERPRERRSRAAYAIVGLLVVAAGLASRRYVGWLPAGWGPQVGDGLWAALVFVGWGWLLPGWGTRRVAALALATAWAVEASQLYQADWLNAIRSWRVGHLVLGNGFHGPDLVAYALGVGLAAGLEGLRGSYVFYKAGMPLATRRSMSSLSSTQTDMPEDDTKEYDSEPAVPPFQQHLDPDNAPSPLPFDKRKRDGEQKFHPEGGPEDPPVMDEEDYKA